MLYNQDIVEATAGVLNVLPELRDELSERGWALDDAEFTFKVFDGKKDGSKKAMLYGRQFGTSVPDVIETAKDMEYISELHVICTCYSDKTCDYLNVSIDKKNGNNEYSIKCWSAKDTSLFITQKDLMRKLKNVAPAEEAVSYCDFSGSIHYIPSVLYPAVEGAPELVNVDVSEMYFLTRRSRFSNVQEHEYLTKLYTEILSVMEKSDVNRPESFDAKFMRKLIEKLPIGSCYNNYKGKLLMAASSVKDGVGFRNPEVVEDFFNEYRKQVRKRCDDLKESAGISVEAYVVSTKRHDGESVLLGLIDDISGD